MQCIIKLSVNSQWKSEHNFLKLIPPNFLLIIKIILNYSHSQFFFKFNIKVILLKYHLIVITVNF